MILPLVPRNDPILKKPCMKWDFESPPPIFILEDFINDLCETMVHHRGVGLSANQVGYPFAIFVIGHPDNPDDIICVVNPKVVDHNNQIILAEEGCLTWKGLYGKVKRWEKIKVRFSNPLGDTETTELSGWTSRIFQHEYDHLCGKTYLDRMSRFHLDQAKRQQKKLDKLRKRNAI